MPKGKEHEEFVTEWMGKIKAGLEYRKKCSTEDKWDDYRKEYRGDWKEGIVPINKIFAYGRSLIPRVYFRNPRIVVKAERPEYTMHARVVEAVDNMLIRETQLKRTIKRAILDTYSAGTGIVKLGFDSEFGYLPEQQVDEDGSTATQESRKEENRKIEYHSTIKPGMPWALRCMPEDIIVPWGYFEPESLPWIGHYILRPLKDVQEDQKYNNVKELKGTKGASIQIRRPGVYKQGYFDRDMEYAELWEIRNYATHEIYVFCEQNLILSADDMLQTEGLPYEFLFFNDDPEYFWGIPDTKLLEGLQHELNETATQESRHRKVALIKFLYKRGMIKEEELTKFFSGFVGPGVAVEDEAENIQNVITVLQPHVPPDFNVLKRNLANDMQEVLGFSVNQMGEFSPYHGKSATESMIVQQAFEARSNERKDLVADMIVNIIRKWNQMIFQLWTKPRVAKIAGPQAAEMWIEYTGEQLEGEYFISADVESGTPMTAAMRLENALKIFDKFNGDQRLDQQTLLQIVLDAAATFEPRCAQLMLQGPPEEAQAIGMERQPTPLGVTAASAGNRGGGRSGSSPEKPQEFEKALSRFRGSATP